MDIATLILVGLNKIFPKPKRPCSSIPDPKDLIISTNPMTIDYFNKQVSKGNNNWKNIYSKYVDFKDKVVLDIGCGLGGSTFAYSRTGAKMTIGLEIEKAFIIAGKKYAVEKYGDNSKFTLMCGDATSIPLESNSVDLVIASDFMEHVDNPEKSMKEVNRILREDGYFFFEFPAYYSPRGAHMHYTIYMPWCQVIFSEDTLVKAAKIIAAKDESFWVFQPGWEDCYRNGLNKLTISRFLTILQNLKDYELADLYYKSEYKLLQPLVYFGRISECLSYVECVLRKKTGSLINMCNIKKMKYAQINKDWEKIKRVVRRMCKN